MVKKGTFWLLVTGLVLLLCGCNIRTINELYCPPNRSEDYMNLQTAMNAAMTGLEYHAPISEENQQNVQMSDLDGDGESEYLLFARGNGENPLKILIFTCVDDEFVLMDTIESPGTAFEQVQYVKMSDREGFDLVVGYQVSNQVVRTVSVYTFSGPHMEKVLTTSYSRFVCRDLDNNGSSELLVLRPAEDVTQAGIAELYSVRDGMIERSPEVSMSEPVDHIKRIMVSPLNDGLQAVYVASEVDGSAIITDIFAVPGGKFSNISFSNDAGTSVQTLRNYFVYADDIDNDGVLELPSLIPMENSGNSIQDIQYLIRWYAVSSDGSMTDKMFSYHNFVGGWYLELDGTLASKMFVTQLGNSYEFFVFPEEGEPVRLMTVYGFTGQQREEQAVSDNRFVLYRTDSTVYAAHLEVASASYGMSQESLKNSFHLIVQDWNTGET
ncbi:MAG: hypothetical protein E7462_06440 [Ruminococcaceae bacterium]|nr:hypothetical protein [Oscillospiraceae bacterium]